MITAALPKVATLVVSTCNWATGEVVPNPSCPVSVIMAIDVPSLSQTKSPVPKVLRVKLLFSKLSPDSIVKGPYDLIFEAV